MLTIETLDQRNVEMWQGRNMYLGGLSAESVKLYIDLNTTTKLTGVFC